VRPGTRAPAQGRHRYELESASAACLAVGVLGIVLGLAAAMSVSWGLVVVLGPPGPRARGVRAWAGVEHWQAPRADLERLRAREREELSGYAWVDSRAGLVRIPLERAMERVASEQTRDGDGEGERGAGAR
jgi:hypothetical protein